MNRPILDITQADIDRIRKIYNKYYQDIDLINVFLQYTIRFPFREGVMDIDVDVLENYYSFKVTPEHSILSVNKPPFKPFEVGLSVTHDGQIITHFTPHEKDARLWLRTPCENRDNAFKLVELSTFAMICFHPFMFAMELKDLNGRRVFSVRKDLGNNADELIMQFIKVQKRERMLDGWDNVTLTAKQYEKVRDYVLDYLSDNEDVDVRALDRFCLNIIRPDGKTDFYFYEFKDNTLYVTFDMYEPNSRFDYAIKLNRTEDGYTPELIESEFEKANKWLHTVVYAKNSDESCETWEWTMWNFFNINTFMLHYGDVTMEVEQKECKPSTQSRTYHKPERNSVRLFKSYTLVKDWRKLARKKAEFTCLCWGVRGHFRHYKNGKVVFVEPYVKGKEKALYKGKDYNLLPYKDA